RLNALPDEGAITDLVLRAGPPDIAAFFNVFLLGRVTNPDTCDGRKVWSRLREGQSKSIAGGVFIVGAVRTIGMRGFDAQGGLEGFGVISFGSGIGLAPFGSAHNFIGDGVICTSSGGVNVALEGELKALGIEHRTIAIDQIGLQGEDQLSGIIVECPGFSRAGDSLELFVQSGQAHIDLVQMGNLIDKRGFLRVDDIWIGTGIDTQDGFLLLDGRGFRRYWSLRYSWFLGLSRLLRLNRSLSRCRAAAGRKDHAGEDEQAQ